MKGLLLAWALCQSFDVATTAVGLERGQFIEANPFLRPSGMVIKVSGNLTGIWAYRKARRDQAARAIIPSAFAIAGCGAGAWNVYQLSHAPKSR